MKQSLFFFLFFNTYGLKLIDSVTVWHRLGLQWFQAGESAPSASPKTRDDTLETFFGV